MTKCSCTARRLIARFARAAEDRRGAVMVEATVILPILLFLAIGVFEFGRIYQHHHVIVKAVRDAGRFLARVPATCPGGAMTNAADEAMAKNLALTGLPAGGSPRLPYWTNPATVVVSVNCLDNSGAAYAGPPFIPLITVTATVPYTDAGFLDTFGFDPITFQVAHQEMNIGE
jgi:Flp pilus assembly protein TadG